MNYCQKPITRVGLCFENPWLAQSRSARDTECSIGARQGLQPHYGWGESESGSRSESGSDSRGSSPSTTAPSTSYSSSRNFWK